MNPLAVLIARYAQASRAIRREIREATRSRFREPRLRRIQVVLRRLRLETPGLVIATVVDRYFAGARGVDRTVRAEPMEGLSGRHRQLAVVTIEELDSKLERVLRTVGERSERAVRGLAAELRDPEEGQVKLGLVRDLEQEGVTALVDRGGKRWSLDVYATMLSRTTAAQAHTNATVARLLEKDLDLIRISSHPHDLDICSPFDGKTFSLTGRARGYPRATLLPPFHPWCKHLATSAPANLAAYERSLRDRSRAG